MLGKDPQVIKIFMYHQVVDRGCDGTETWYRVPVDRFRKQIEWLDRWGFTAITFDDYRLYLDGVLNLPKKAVILTFDDGYLDNYKNAFPILKEYGMKAVLFVLGNRKIKSNIWDETPSDTSALLMNDYQIVEMHRAGFEIGAHSCSHAKLTEVSKDVAWEEIYYSRMALEALLHAPVRSFAYPYGDVNSETKRMVTDAGYSIACSVFSGPATFGSDAFEIRRTTILNTTGAVGLGLRLFLPYEQYEWLRWKISRYLKGNRMKVTQQEELVRNPDSPEVSLVQRHQ